MRQTLEYTIFDAATPVAITSSTDATPIVVTSTAHGLVTGDYVYIQGHTTNVAANGIYKVVKVTANTFQLTDLYTGAAVAGSGAGAGSSGFCVKIITPFVYIQDFRNVQIALDTSGSATLTMKAFGSIGKLNNSTSNITQNAPNFGGTIAVANPYTAIQVINLDTAAAINGATGVALTGTDFHTLYEANVNALKYLTFVPSAWTQGAITVKMQVVTNL